VGAGRIDSQNPASVSGKKILTCAKLCVWAKPECQSHYCVCCYEFLRATKFHRKFCTLELITVHSLYLHLHSCCFAKRMHLFCSSTACVANQSAKSRKFNKPNS